MLSSAIEFLENYPSRIIQVNLAKNKKIDQLVYTILAKTEKGVETFQLQGYTIYHMSTKDREVVQTKLFEIPYRRESRRGELEQAVQNGTK